jgi:hypothetical protein
MCVYTMCVEAKQVVGSGKCIQCMCVGLGVCDVCGGCVCVAVWVVCVLMVDVSYCQT